MDVPKFSQPLIEICGLHNRFGRKLVHEELELSINRGEIVAIIGPSGCGKTTLLRSILMLQKPTSGNIRVFGINVVNCTEVEALSVQRRWGVMFQSSALFSSLRVLENILFPLQKYSNLEPDTQKKIALLKIALTGLESDAANKYPAELSGGMKKRVALARAIALDPELVFLDEPTTGLDPKSASEMDELILHLKEILGLTVVLVTHDLDTLWRVTDRVVFFSGRKVLAVMSMSELVRQKHPAIQDYFSGGRSTFHGNPASEARDGHQS